MLHSALIVRTVRLLSVLLLGLSLYFAPLARPASAQTRRSPDLLPPGAVVLLRVHDVQHTLTLLQDTAIGQAYQDPQARPFLMAMLEDGLGGVWSSGSDNEALSFLQFVNYLQGDLTFGLFYSELRSQHEPVFCFQVTPAAVETLHAWCTAQIKAVNTETDPASGLQLHQGSSGNHAYFEHQGFFAMGGAETVAKVAANAVGAGEMQTLRGDSRYSTLMSGAKASSDESVQISWMVDPVTMFIDQAQGNIAQQLTVATFPALGIDGIQGISGSTSLTAGTGFDQVTHVHVSLDNPRAGLVDLVQLPSEDLTPEFWVPEDVSSYRTINWDLQATYANGRKLAESFNFEGSLDRWLQNNLSRQLGVDFIQEILPLLAGRYSYMSHFTSAVARPGNLLAVKVTSPESFKPILSKIAANYQDRVEERWLGTQSCWVAKQPEGLPEGINPNQMPQFCFALVDDYIMVANSFSLLEHIVLHKDKPEGKSLADSLEYRLIASRAKRIAGSNKPGVISFGRPEHLLRYTYQYYTLPENLEQLRQMANFSPLHKILLAGLESNTLPPFEVFEKYLAPSGNVIYDSSSGLHYTGFTLRRGEASGQ